ARRARAGETLRSDHDRARIGGGQIAHRASNLPALAPQEVTTLVARAGRAFEQKVRPELVLDHGLAWVLVGAGGQTLPIHEVGLRTQLHSESDRLTRRPRLGLVVD